MLSEFNVCAVTRVFTNPVPTTADCVAVIKRKEAERIQSNVTEPDTVLLTVLSAGNATRGPVFANCATLYQLLRLTVRYICCVRTIRSRKETKQYCDALTMELDV